MKGMTGGAGNPAGVLINDRRAVFGNLHGTGAAVVGIFELFLAEAKPSDEFPPLCASTVRRLPRFFATVSKRRRSLPG